MIKDIISANTEASSNSREIAVLKKHFPACFKNDGSFDIVRFGEYINKKLVVQGEGYELRFLGKNYARLLASVDTTTVIVPDNTHNEKPENTNSQNIYISGDNIDALKHLLKSYSNKVKCIYIDPPYNTGSDDFVYNDNYSFTAEELESKLSINIEQANRIIDLTKRGSASHSAWLMFMYPRLLLARDLLSEDGVLFISIDDNEQANLKIICDDIFHEENFVANIIVQANKRGQTYKQLAKTHEYLFVITKNAETSLNELMKGEGAFTKVDSIGEFEERELRNRNPKYGRFNRPNLFYPIYANPNMPDEYGFCPVSLAPSHEFCVEILPYNSKGEESCWRWGTAKFEKNNCSEDSMKSHVVAKKKTTGEYGCYEKYRKGTYKAKTIWADENLIGDLFDEEDDIWEETGVITEQGSTELGKYGMGDAFEFPKPTYLIKKALKIGANADSLCVDFFSGSATSTDALMALNAEDGGCRKIIAVQLPENLDTKFTNAPASKKAKVKKTIDFLDSVSRSHELDQVGMERISRAALEIRKIYPNTKADLGFRHYILKEPSSTTLDKMDKFVLEENSLLACNSILEDFGESTVLTTWLLRDGYGFTREVQAIDFSGYRSYYIDKHLYLINPGLSNEAIVSITDRYETVGTFNPENVVLFGYSFSWTELESLKINLARLKDTEKNLRINFDIRY